ncbi:MAG: TPM domain-containing protein [Planctomycetota bacterium]|nr:MAG: TPM domain-containing protein [Planctomycetota bacterium]
MGLEAAATQATADWSEQYSTAAAWWVWALAIALTSALALLVVRAMLTHRQYKVRFALPEEGRRRVEEAVAAAERRTVGEILPVVLGRSDRYPAANLVCGILFAIAGFLIAWAIPVRVEPLAYLMVQLGSGFLGWMLCRSLPELRRRFVPPWQLSAMAEETAAHEFFRQNLHNTRERTGVLLFVSLFERRVVVLGDEGIASQVNDKAWKELNAVILEAAARGALAEGLCAAVERMGAVLAEHFPWQEGDRDELPNHVVVRAE